MILPRANHPIWPIARVLVMLLALYLCLSLTYNSSFDSKDARTMFVVALFSALAEGVKRMLTSDK